MDTTTMIGAETLIDSSSNEAYVFITDTSLELVGGGTITNIL